jgi:aminoglycoside phosphotransferase (APT) family kinase protein
MHADEVDTDEALVRDLLAHQHPQWADLPIERVPSAGTDNALYRLGDDLAVRLPRIHWAVDTVAKEQTWLPVVAPHLPLPVPLPVAAGEPEDAFPYPWGVVQWLPGTMASLDQLDDPVQAARDLAGFVRALRAIDPTGGPTHNRGRPIRLGDELVRAGIAQLDGVLDTEALTDAWNRAIAVADHAGPPVWFHGDLAYLNLLAQGGRLSAVIDWGTCGVGDPAIDTIVAWSLFTPEARAAYRDALDIDDAEWERGKGWVITGIFGILSYHETNPVLAADKRTAIDALLDDAIL